MAINFTAVIVDSSSRPRANLTVRAGVLDARGNFNGKQGKTDARGRAQITAARSSAEGQPRVVLQARYTAGGDFVTLTDKPISFRGNQVDFGQVVDPGPRPTISAAARHAGTPLTGTTIRDHPTVTPTPSTPAAAGGQAEGASVNIQQLNLRVQSLERTNSDLQRNLQARDQELEQLRGELETDIQQRDTQIRNLQQQLEAVSSQVRSEFQAQLDQKEDRIKQLQDRLAEQAQRAATGGVTMEQLFATTGEQLERVSQQMNQAGSSFRLGKVQMNLKGLPTEGGSGFSFIDKEELKDIRGDLISELNMEFEPIRDRPAPETPQVGVPDLAGYTHVMARRKVEGLGLEMQVRHQTVRDSQSINRVVSQEPAAGTRMAPGTIITVTIGTPLESE